MSPSPAQFDVLVHALTQVGTLHAPADVLLKQFFRDRKALGARDRAFVSDTVYLGLRRSRWLEALVPGGEPRRQAFAILGQLRGLSLRDLEPLCRGGELEWLKGLRARPDNSASLGLQADLPDWVIERLRSQMDDAAVLALGRAMQQAAPLDLRVNSLKARPEQVQTLLGAAGISASPMHLAPLGLRIQGKPSLQALSVYREGLVEVQDEGSQLLGHLLAPRRGEMVVDFCAGAGGKTLLLGALMQNEGRLYAFDVSEKRLANLKPRLKRSGLSNVHPVLITSERDNRVKRLAGKIDRVLVDAPCSGLGTLRRNPDLKQRIHPDGVAELCAKQSAILTAAATLLKPGGTLLYATCSLLADENEAQADRFSAAHPGFRPLSCTELLRHARIALDTGPYLRLLPHLHGTDGFFAAAWQRDTEPVSHE